MTHKALIQKKDELVLRNISNVAWDGFNYLGYETRWFTADEFKAGEVEVTQDTVVCAFIWMYLEALKRLGIEPPANVDYPDDLKPYLGRAVWRSTIDSVRRELVDPKEHFFVKPYSSQKGFTGFITNQERRQVRLSGWPSDTEVWCSEIVEFVSEYRFFVMRGVIEGVGHYRGNPTIFPDGKIVQEAAAAWKDAPASYCLDFGVDAHGRTLLVEVNDGHSMGDYGLYPPLYARLCEARWCELTGKDPLV